MGTLALRPFVSMAMVLAIIKGLARIRPIYSEIIASLLAYHSGGDRLSRLAAGPEVEARP